MHAHSIDRWRDDQLRPARRLPDAPQAPDAYKARLSGIGGLSHVTMEVHACPGSADRPTRDLG